MNLSVKVGSVALANPVMPASGTFGFGREMTAIWDTSQLGALISKGVTPEPRLGNDPPRVAETASGMLNSVGLQNPGIEAFLQTELPFMQSVGVPVVVNAAGFCTEDYTHLCSLLDAVDIAAIELNLSCPNVRTGCMSVGADPRLVGEVVGAVRKVTTKPLWIKLTPNVTDVAEVARAAEAAGADAISLINTLLGMRIDIHSRRPVLRNNTGGLSGPAVFPVAVRMVRDVYQAVDIPVVGMGGIQTGEDVIEMMLAGASAVEVGTATLNHPSACLDILDGIRAYMERKGVVTLSELTGAMQPW